MWRHEAAESGSVGVVFGISIFTLSIAIGIAVDYSAAVRSRTKLTAAADAAVLAGSRAAINALDSSAGNGSWQEAAKSATSSFFNANMDSGSQSQGADNSGSKISSISATKVGSSIVVALDASGSVPTSFMRLAGIKSIPINVKVQSSSRPPNFLQVNFIIDNSGSMGIGATTADQNLMYSKIGCTIACHYNDTFGDMDTVAQARGTGAKLRIDVVKEAAVKIVTSLKANQLASEQFEVGIYTMSNNITKVLAPSTNLDAVISAINSIDLATANNDGGSNFTYSLSQFASQSQASGSGSQSGDRKITTVVMTDGLEDSVYESLNTYWTNYMGFRVNTPIFDPNFTVRQPNYSSFAAFETMQPIGSESCAPLKSKAHEVMFMNVEYLVPVVEYWQSRYWAINTLLKPEIAPNLRNCASKPEYVYNASSPSEIMAASDKLYTAITQPNIRLTN